jgi:hypothetical protein
MLNADGVSKLGGPLRPDVAEYRAAVGFYTLEDAEGNTRNGGGELVGFHVDEDKLPWLVQQARADPSAFDALGSLSRLYVRCGRPIPLALRPHVLDALSGKAARPNLKRSKHWRRDALLATLIHDVAARYALYPTRNDETSAHNSAADVVAGAFRDFGFKEVSYEIAKKAYYRNRKGVTDPSAE